MIIITGTRRSGTSLWMQILKQGGFKIFGDEFPANWQELVKEANPKGFYESKLVEGINYNTNPDPETGAWLPPHQVENYGVKIFADGIVKTDFAYISKVIMSVRKWQDSESSQLRMNDIKTKNPQLTDLNGDSVNYPIGFAWWKAYFSLVKDMQIRRYPAAVFSYERLLNEPEKVIRSVFGWLGTGNVDNAVMAVENTLQTQKNVVLPNINHDFGPIFDELYDVLDRRIAISPTFFRKLAETDMLINQQIKSIHV